MPVTYIWEGSPESHRFRVPSPDGVSIDVVVENPDSQLANRFLELWKGGGLLELVQTAVAERSHFRSETSTLCHNMAFEFAYAICMTMGGLDPALKAWRWSVAETIRGTHSWVEHQGEAIDFQMAQVEGEPELTHCAFVRPTTELRSKYQAKRVENLTFLAFGRWISHDRPTDLFSLHPEVSKQATSTKIRVRLSGRMNRPGGPRFIG